MKLPSSFICAILLLFVMAGCSTIPNAHITSTPEKVIVKQSTRLIHPSTYGNSTYDIPAGEYIRFYEDKNRVLYLNREVRITKKWNELKKPDRARFGGFMIVKSAGLWWLFSLGPVGDLAEDGMPELGLLFPDKVSGEAVNTLGLAGRTNEQNVMVEADRRYGYLENPDLVVFVGSVPISKK